MLILVTYDVSLTDVGGQKRLRRVAKVCQNYGVRVQNSVFECVVDEAQFVLLRDRLKKEIAPEQDSLRFYRLGNNYKDKVEHYGVKREISVDEPLIL